MLVILIENCVRYDVAVGAGVQKGTVRIRRQIDYKRASRMAFYTTHNSETTQCMLIGLIQIQRPKE